ncbi:hypothetical protein DFH06DRAFT_1335601 [Mycena polygramma]|nr:hypothetical protein DFH06DRAFT_1335601 [Mycena polygramma]
MSPVFSRPVVDPADLPVPMEIWLYIIHLSMPDQHNFPATYAHKRALLATVCREWKCRIYSDKSFWNYLSINQHVKPFDLDFVLSRCATVPLHVRLSFMDVLVRRRDAEPPLPLPQIVSNLFGCIARTSARWSAFYLFTDDSEAFKLVRSHCEFLRAPELSSFALNYFIDGYSVFDEDDPFYFDPLNPCRWFTGSDICPRHLELYGASVCWETPAFFQRLVSLDLVGLASPGMLLVDWPFFVALFSTADRLRFLRLADIPPFPIPSSATICSPTLAVLDVSIGEDAFLVRLMLAMDVPALTDLTLRACYATLGYALHCGHILRRLVCFALHGDIACGTPLYPLFDSMPLLEVLDFSCTKYYVLQSYFQWNIAVYRRSKPFVYVPSLRSITVGIVDIVSLLEFVTLCGANGSKDGSHMRLRHVRVDDRVAAWGKKEYGWLGNHITDFGSTPYTHFPVSRVAGPTAHSLFTFP